MMCKPGEMISGYRAAVRNLGFSYVSDVEFQCARIVSSAVRVQRVFPVSPEGRHWIHPAGSLAAALGGGLEPRRTCGKYGATGLGVAVGKYINRSNVVQTMGLFCGKPDQARGCPQGSSSFPELSGVYGSNPCQPCVALHSSTVPLVGSLDRKISNFPVARYNCHYYTLSFMNRTAPLGVRKRVPRMYEWNMARATLGHRR